MNSKNPNSQEPQVYQSPILANLEMPSISTICQYCPKSLWFIEDEIKCYCQAMNSLTYIEGEPQITECDGQILAIAELLQQAEKEEK